MFFDADRYWKNKEIPCPYAEGNRCFLVIEPCVESCKGCRWYEPDLDIGKMKKSEDK